MKQKTKLAFMQVRNNEDLPDITSVDQSINIKLPWTYIM